MTATPAQAPPRPLAADAVDRVVRRLESGFGDRPSHSSMLANQYLLDALDRGEHRRFLVWPPSDPTALLYVGQNGTIVPAGSPDGGAPLADEADRTGWRVMIGDEPICSALLLAYRRGLFRKRPNAREQRFLVADPVRVPRPEDEPEPAGMRLARRSDLDELTELASQLHVEDRMGPPISRSGRAAVRERMLDSVLRGSTWVVERDARVVAKVDLSLRSARRGAQIAGVYVAQDARSQGIAGATVAAITRNLLAEGVPGVTLHVRADNAPGLAAYRRAGFLDRAAWILALR